MMHAALAGSLEGCTSLEFLCLASLLYVLLDACSVTCKTNITFAFLALSFTVPSRRTLFALVRFQHARIAHCTTIHILLPATASARPESLSKASGLLRQARHPLADSAHGRHNVAWWVMIYGSSVALWPTMPPEY
jgi:hypothetical protein